jgi:hypothetical protein
VSVLDATAAGAAGTTALNVATYLDMAIRGRPASQSAEETVRRLADRSHIGLGPEQKAANRRSGLGPLLGYIAGIGAAVIFGSAARNRPIPVPVGATLLGAGAMLAADAPLAALRVSDPRTWSRTDWLADIVPHLIYGVVTAAVWHRLASAHRRGRTRFSVRRV